MATRRNPHLTDAQADICFRKGTEPPGSGKYLHTKDAGTYHCVNCGQELFSSTTKYDSKTGWPSFWDEAPEARILKKDDSYLGTHFFEVQCGNCGIHLGHVFDDGPKPTGKRYCINSLALEFKAAQS